MSAARRARLWLSAAAVAGYLPLLGMPLRGWLDFSGFYVGGRLVFRPDLLDPLAVVAFQASQGMPPTPFVSPPFVALLYAPLSTLPYDLAAIGQIVAMELALLGGAVLWSDALGLPRRWGVLGALAWGPASAGVVSGQIDSLAFFATGLLVRLLGEGGRFGAGLSIALLAFKPHVTFGVGLAALPRLGRRGFAGLVIAGIGLYLLSALAVGGDLAWPGRWMAALESYTAADFAANGWQASGPVSLGVRWTLASGSLAPLGAGLAVGLAVVALAVRYRAPASIPADVAVWAGLGVVLSPHAWVYDATLLLPSLGVLAAAVRRGWPLADVALLGLAYAAAALWPFGGILGVTLMPLVAMAIPVRAGKLAASTPALIGPLGHGSAGEGAATVRDDPPI